MDCIRYVYETTSLKALEFEYSMTALENAKFEISLLRTAYHISDIFDCRSKKYLLLTLAPLLRGAKKSI